MSLSVESRESVRVWPLARSFGGIGLAVVSLPVLGASSILVGFGCSSCNWFATFRLFTPLDARCCEEEEEEEPRAPLSAPPLPTRRVSFANSPLLSVRHPDLGLKTEKATLLWWENKDLRGEIEAWEVESTLRGCDRGERTELSRVSSRTRCSMAACSSSLTMDSAGRVSSTLGVASTSVGVDSWLSRC